MFSNTYFLLRINLLLILDLSTFQFGIILFLKGLDFEEKDKRISFNVKQCLHKVIDGHFIIVAKVLGSFRMAPYNGNIMKVLKAKHPYSPPSSMLTTLFSEAPFMAKVDTIFECIKPFPKWTSCSIDGLQAQHILCTLCVKGFVVAIDILYAITLVVNLWI